MRRVISRVCIATSLAAVLLMVLTGCSPTVSYASGLTAASPTTGSVAQTATALASPTVSQQGTPPAIPSASVTATATLAAPKLPTPAIRPTVQPYQQVPTITEYPLSTYTSLGNRNPITVSCPQGAYALGGGWSVPGQSARVYAASVSGNSWVVRVHSLLGLGVQVPVTVYVECLGNVTSATITQNMVSSSAGPNMFIQQPASCGSGIPVGYSFDLSASATGLELQGTTPETFEAAAWWNFVVMNHDSVARQISVSVVCLSSVTVEFAGSLKSLGIYPSYPGQGGAAVPAGTTGTTTVACPAGTLVAGGGLIYDTTQNPANNGIGNIASLHAVSGGWQGALYGVSGGAPIPTIFGVCLTLA